MTDLNRFISAQDQDYKDALKEIKRGYKMGHWIWYIFPQVKGLGLSSMSEYYGISSRQEAEDYLAHPVLNQRLREITTTLLIHSGKLTTWEILGTTDAMKVRSCMTLFDAISPNDIFANVLNNFYDGVKCGKTLDYLRNRC